MPETEDQIADEPIFNAQELDQNNLRRQKLIAFIKSGEAILMAGAGSSGNIYPPWPEFVALLKKTATDINPDFNEDESDFLAFADKVKLCLGDDHYYKVISDTFAPLEKTHEEFHEVICRMPFRGFTTTNYDMVLESALISIRQYPDYALVFDGTAKNLINRFLLSLNDRHFHPKKVAHLHGKYDVKGSIVLSESEYSAKYGFSIIPNELSLFDTIQNGNISKEEFNELIRKYGYEWPIGRKLLWSLLATRRLVFVGFSLNDQYFQRMLEYVKEDLATYNSETHFIILRITKGNMVKSKNFAHNLKQTYGIETVFYEEEDGRYDALADFIINLGQEVMDIVTAQPVAEEVRVVKQTDEGSQEVTDELMELAKKLD